MATKQEPIRRNDVIRCEKCGEDYSITYKRCPFCDERPGHSPRAGVSSGGRRVAGGHSSANPLQIGILVLSVVLIIAAAFIVFTTLAPLLGGDEPDASQSQPGISASQPQPGPSVSGDVSSGDVSTGDVSTGDVSTGDISTGDISQPEQPPVSVVVNSLKLNKSDFTLKANESAKITATVNPSDAQVTWTSSNESAAKVAPDGTVVNVNTGASQVKVTITATAGDKSAQCTVYCRGGSSGTAAPSTPSTPGTSSGVASGSAGKVSGAGNGLNVRSGPGSSYEAIASLPNGTNVKILQDSGSGWYKISFSGVGGRTTEGYVSKDYISVN